MNGLDAILPKIGDLLADVKEMLAAVAEGADEKSKSELDKIIETELPGIISRLRAVKGGATAPPPAPEPPAQKPETPMPTPPPAATKPAANVPSTAGPTHR